MHHSANPHLSERRIHPFTPELLPSFVFFPSPQHVSPRTLLLLATATLLPTAAAIAFATAPNASHILVLSTTGGVATLNEWTTAAGQSAPVQSVSVTGCSLSTAAAQAYGSMSSNGERGRRQLAR
jgi:hypothetical protein